MNAAFVDIGLERNGFLCADDAAAHLGEEASASLRKANISDMIKVDQEVLVQVVKEAVGTKGARITTFVTMPGRYLVLIPAANYTGVSRRIEDESERSRLRSIADQIKPDGMGLILRTSATGRSFEELEAELNFLVKSWHRVQKASKRRRAPAIVHQELALIDKILRDILHSDVNRLILSTTPKSTPKSWSAWKSPRRDCSSVFTFILTTCRCSNSTASIKRSSKPWIARSARSPVAT